MQLCTSTYIKGRNHNHDGGGNVLHIDFIDMFHMTICFLVLDQNIRRALREQFIFNLYDLRRMLHDAKVSPPANTNNNYRRSYQ